MKKEFKDLSVEEFVRVICGVPKKYEFEVKYLTEKGIRIDNEHDYIKGDYWTIHGFLNDHLISDDGNTRNFMYGAITTLEETCFDYALDYSLLDIYEYLESKTKGFEKERCKILYKDLDFYYFLIKEEIGGDEFCGQFFDYSRSIAILLDKIGGSNNRLQQQEKQSPTLPKELDTPEAKKWLKKAIDGGLLNDDYTTTDKVKTKPQKALLAEILSEKIGLEHKYVSFEKLWDVKKLTQSRYKSKEERGKVCGGELIEAVFAD